MELLRQVRASRNAPLVGVLLLCFSTCVGADPQWLTPPSIPAAPLKPPAATTQQAKDPFEVFTPEEMRDFVVAARKADAIKDPMKHCLNFPDPPGSHWSHAGVVAYCQYILQTTISLAEFDHLIMAGQAKELDRRFSSWEADPKAHPEALWHFLTSHFSAGDPYRQTLIESWKQQSPDSAYAYVVSGWNYTAMGWSARGGGDGDETPQESREGMANSMERARGDIAKAIRLNPKLTVPYANMINIGTATSDRAYAAQGMEEGLRIKASNYAVFVRLAFFASSRWQGTPELRQWILAQTEQIAREEPLFHVIPAIVFAYEAMIDYRAPVDGDWTIYKRVFDDVAQVSLLQLVGDTALRHRQYAVAYVYLSESSRFDPHVDVVNEGRVRAASFIDMSPGAH